MKGNFKINEENKTNYEVIVVTEHKRNVFKYTSYIDASRFYYNLKKLKEEGYFITNTNIIYNRIICIEKG